MSGYPRNRMTYPIAGLFVLAGGVFLWGRKSLLGGEGQPSKGNPPTPVSMKSSPPQSEGGGPVDGGHSKIVSQGTDTSKKGKEAFQDAVKGTRGGKAGSDGSDLDTQIDNRTPSKERVARGGN
ncbi:hypothetical protein P389DRAFT_209306 [Cystobasidium minutum MCA 4210]|uniref:uncharacterized protein n=1 Tax=Cystobasidium minutum MCA 4210 TaxID=1397322 RepID=UPI0034CD939E|eukprot:jgi/Rhomi1/209306/estExt_Genemark1.C_2_t30149